MNAAVKPEMKPAEAFKARQAKIAEIEKANADPTKGIRADVVTLYAGGQYHLYTFKKYTDIRLVFAPEKADRLLRRRPGQLRVPAVRPRRLLLPRLRERQAAQDRALPEVVRRTGPRTDELVFVSGHPGRTNRQNTMAELEYLRDTGYPYLLQRLNRLEVLLGAWVERSEANRQKGEDELFGIQNSRKARIGGLAGLLDPSVMGRKVADEKRLRDFIAKADAGRGRRTRPGRSTRSPRPRRSGRRSSRT